MAETRLLPVPDGLDGLRLDAALARMTGFSRTVAAELIDAGHVTMDGVQPARSVKVRGGTWLELILRLSVYMSDDFSQALLRPVFDSMTTAMDARQMLTSRISA